MKNGYLKCIAFVLSICLFTTSVSADNSRRYRKKDEKKLNRFKFWPQQGGNRFSTALKLEHNSENNKFTLPALEVKTTFDLVPGREEAGSMYSEVQNAGYDIAPFYLPRDQSQEWYVATADEDNFYYSVFGQSSFSSVFSPYGTSSLFVARSKKDASLVWVKSVNNYLLTSGPNWVGSPNTLARTALAIHKDKLYVTTMFTGAGPQLIAVDKKTGNSAWTMAYQPPEFLGHDYFVTPSTPIHALPNGIPSLRMGDLNIVCADLEEDRVSVFVGISSYQNAFNIGSILGGFPTYQDQGALIRIDDMGTTAEKVWTASTCAKKLAVGDTISNADSEDTVYNAFRPGQNEVLIFRDTTASGTFNAPGGVVGRVLDYNGGTPGYMPKGYPTLHNNTMPAMANVFLVTGAPPLTEASLPSLFRSVSPGIGSVNGIYSTSDAASGPLNVTDLLTALNALQATLLPTTPPVKVVIWTYLTQSQVNAVDEAAWGVSNQNVRYIASLPTGYTISNDQEAAALNYYGNAVWAQAPVIDTYRNMAFFGTGQTHDMPVDEVLFYQNPAIEYLSRKQPVINTMYQYAHPDSSTTFAPFSSLKDVKREKKRFTKDTLQLNENYSDRSPRGNRSYPDSIMGVDLTTGEIHFGVRSLPHDAATFATDDPALLAIKQNAITIDGDISSGIMYFDKVKNSHGKDKTYLAGISKSSVAVVLDITKLKPDVVFTHTNVADKGVKTHLLYTGPDGAYGGSNYGSTQDGKSRVIFAGANDSSFIRNSFAGSRSFTYDTGYYQGYEFHVTHDGRVFPIMDSFVAAVDVAKRKIVWETEMGQRSHPFVTGYNGVAYTSRGDGMLFGIDMSTGKVLWKLDGQGRYGFSGINAPTFSNGKAIWMDNYNAGGGIIGTLGGTGTMMKVKKSLIVEDSDNLRTLTKDKTFTSFDVLPKSPGASVFDSLVDNETVKHMWRSGGILEALHTNLLNNTETTLSLEVEEYHHNSHKVTFRPNNDEQTIRYKSISFFNKDNYVLEYEVAEGPSWIAKEATLRVDQ